MKANVTGGQRIALRINGVVRWLTTDHLGSTALTVSEAGGRLSEIRYKPWGESRYTFGATPTQRRFTGQVLDEVAGGLYFYNARYYDPALGRFISADTSVISVLKNLATFRTAGRSASLRSCVEFLI